jgi:3-dehydroquinate synthetase
MASVPIALEGQHHEVIVGSGVRSRARELAAGRDQVAILADRRVTALHGPLIEGTSTLEVNAGESLKSMDGLAEVLDFCAAAGLSRGSLLIAYGGGTVGDLGGLAASLFKRGVDVLQVPTTLLAQVDASVGGKTAINLRAGKNLAGSFHQPAGVLCDTALLATLSDADFASGLGEVIKTSIIGGEATLGQIEVLMDALIERDPSALAAVVEACVRVKAQVVVSDPEERGPRRALNLGHTFAHAIESAAGFGVVPHGVAVGVGLGLAARAAEATCGAARALTERTDRLLERAGLPATLEALRSSHDLAAQLTPDALRAGLAHDKKGSVGAPEFVLARRAGDVIMGQPLGEELLAELLA